MFLFNGHIYGERDYFLLNGLLHFIFIDTHE